MSAPAHNDVLVVGNALTGPLLVELFRGLGQAAQALVLESCPLPATLRVPIHIGNGEYYANARKVFGAELAETIWEVSTASLRRARSLGMRWGVQPTPKRLVWYATSEREATLQRETIALLPDRILRVPEDKRFLSLLEEPTLLWQPLPADSTPRIASLDGLEKAGLDTIVHFHRAGRPESIRAAVVVLASEEISGRAVPFLADKWIPVTLSSFGFPALRPLPHAAAYCNGGADFAVTDGVGWRLGSFRNLYQDKAVGHLAQPDPATLSGVHRYFGDLGWINPRLEPTTVLAYEALPCDGLPIVGALSDFPGVYALGGFAARSLNFIFEIAHRLAADIVRGGDFQTLRAFSSKRFL